LIEIKGSPRWLSGPVLGTKVGSCLLSVVTTWPVIRSCIRVNWIDSIREAIKDFQFRFEEQLAKVYSEFTSNSDDWQLFLLIDGLSYYQAREMERHIKKMKSSGYIQNLAKYPEMIAKLKDRSDKAQGSPRWLSGPVLGTKD
jgi:putative endonuclease